MPKNIAKTAQQEAVPAVVSGAGVVAGVAAARAIKSFGTDKIDALRNIPEVASVGSIAAGVMVRNANRDFSRGWIGGATGVLLLQLLGRVMTVPRQLSLGNGTGASTNRSTNGGQFQLTPSFPGSGDVFLA